MRRNKHTRSDSTTGYVGVYFDKRYEHFQAQIRCGKGETVSLGTYEEAEEAALIVNEAYERIGEEPPNKLTTEQLRHVTQLRISRRADAIRQQREREMRVPKIRGVKGVEYKLQQKIIEYLRDRGWFVKPLTGTMYQWGFPDLFACHKRYGIKIIEIKNPELYSFTAAQIQEFPKFISNGAPVYVMTAANKENYDRLFGPSNYWLYISGIKEK